MEIKKNPKKELETIKGLFFKSGLVVSLMLVLFAFEWKNYVKDSDEQKIWGKPIAPDTDVVIPTFKEPEPQKPVFQQMKIVDNIDEPEDEFFVNPEISDTTKVIEYYVPKEDFKEPEVKDDIPFIASEVMPEFQGGEAKMLEFLGNNIKYPDLPKTLGIEGTVYLMFVVEKDGSISNINIKRGVFEDLDKEAVRVVKLMPKWNPGLQRSVPVRVWFSLPIKFTLK